MRVKVSLFKDIKVTHKEEFGRRLAENEIDLSKVLQALKDSRRIGREEIRTKTGPLKTLTKNLCILLDY